MGIQEFAIELVDGIFQALTWQSVFLLLVGAGLIALGVARRTEYTEL